MTRKDIESTQRGACWLLDSEPMYLTYQEATTQTGATSTTLVPTEKEKKKSCLLLSFQLLVAAEHGRGGRGPPWRRRLCCLPAAAHGSLDVLDEGLQLVAEEDGQRHRDRHRDHVLVQTPAEGEQAATPPSTGFQPQPR